MIRGTRTMRVVQAFDQRLSWSSTKVCGVHFLEDETKQKKKRKKKNAKIEKQKGKKKEIETWTIVKKDSCIVMFVIVHTQNLFFSWFWYDLYIRCKRIDNGSPNFNLATEKNSLVVRGRYPKVTNKFSV